MNAVDRVLKVYDRKSNNVFKLEPGEKKIVRLLPPYDPSYRKKAAALGAIMDPRSGIVVIRRHAFLPKYPLEKDEQRGDYRVTNWRCLQDLNKPCPFCQWFEQLDRKEDWGIIGQFGSRPNPMVDLYIKSEGVAKRWYGLQKRVVERFRDLFDTFSDLNDSKTGRWLLIKRIGAKMDTEYQIKVLKPGKFDLPDDQYPDDIIDEIQNHPIVKGPKTAAAVLKAKFPDLF